MLSIHPVLAGPDHVVRQNDARLIFQEYARFLQSLAGHAAFDFVRFETEIANLPCSYTDGNGEVLLAYLGSAPAACIAYRETAAPLALRSCEIKRLFVLPQQRGHGIAKQLVGSVLQRAASRGYLRAELDTDKIAMTAAYATYIKAGFQEYARTLLPENGPVVFLERALP